MSFYAKLSDAERYYIVARWDDEQELVPTYVSARTTKGTPHFVLAEKTSGSSFPVYLLASFCIGSAV
jgi:hypothetical protein